jgi:hypothetical protein
MSRTLSDFLGAKEPSFTHTLRRLEAESGHPDIDVKLTSDIARIYRTKLREFELDPNDTTGQELYHSLQSLVAKHDDFLLKVLGADSSTKLNDLLGLIVNKVKSMPVPKNCWALKYSSAKKLLKESPPKKLMKFLGYRSIDSLLKRETLDQVYAGIQLLESANWRSKFISSYNKLSPSDFEDRSIKIVLLDAKRWGEAAQNYTHSNGKNILTLKEVGIAAVLPLDLTELKGVTITLMPMLLGALNELHIYSSYFKLQQVKPDFAHILVSSLNANEPGDFKLGNQKLSWRVIHRHYGSKATNGLPEIFDPYIQAEDLAWQNAESLIYKLEPALKFWEDMDWVAAKFDDRPIPFGLADNAVSYLNGLDYGQQSVSHFRLSLSDELYKRYIAQKPIEDQIIKQLEVEPHTANPLIVDLRSLF